VTAEHEKAANEALPKEQVEALGSKSKDEQETLLSEAQIKISEYEATVAEEVEK